MSDWTLSFDLPAGTRISTLWNAQFQVTGQHVDVRPPSWEKAMAAGKSVTIGFVATTPHPGADPTACTINGSDCATGGEDPAPPAEPSPPPPSTSDTKPAPTSSAKKPVQKPTPKASTPKAASGGFSPYVDTSLFPAYDMLGTAKNTGVKNFTLAFVLSGGGCTPKWGGVTDLNTDGVPGQIGQLRQQGGDVRVSFGGANGIELAKACGDAGSLADAYGKAISTYGLTKADFDIEGSALPDNDANTRRAQAIAKLQQQAKAAGKTLDVSFTLPVLPSGLTQDGVNLLSNAKANGVDVAAVNVMAMDYGDGAAPNPDGKMGQFAIDAATATQAQVKSVFGLADADAWKRVAVTPMIGVNDTSTEVFRLADAQQLTEFAGGKHLAWLAMWSATRDQPCPGGGGTAQATCSGIDQQALDFTKAFGSYGG
jgi:hypothetical protein